MADAKITIYYCPPCGLRKPAERIAEALERELSLGAEIREGFWGTFRVECDGEVIFNRWKDRGWLGRLGFGAVPTPEEIVVLVRQHLPADQPENPVRVS
ncbi:MAG: Rdx family protein [Planctomycetaceae bacterium]|nr:Rdx family protein [Planctomycetaceae bacterium]